MEKELGKITIEETEEGQMRVSATGVHSRSHVIYLLSNVISDLAIASDDDITEVEEVEVTEVHVEEE